MHSVWFVFFYFSWCSGDGWVGGGNKKKKVLFLKDQIQRDFDSRCRMARAFAEHLTAKHNYSHYRGVRERKHDSQALIS